MPHQPNELTPSDYEIARLTGQESEWAWKCLKPAYSDETVVIHAITPFERVRVTNLWKYGVGLAELLLADGDRRIRYYNRPVEQGQRNYFAALATIKDLEAKGIYEKGSFDQAICDMEDGVFHKLERWSRVCSEVEEI